MSWKNASLIFLREVRDQLRDRRTLFMVAVLPLLLYPALGMGMLKMMVTFSEETRRVVLIGADQLPEPALFAGQRFHSKYFDNPADAERLELITDLPGALDEISPGSLRETLTTFLAEAQDKRQQIEALASKQAGRETGPPSEEQPAAESGNMDEKQIRQGLQQWFAQAPAQVLILFPSDFLEKFQAVSEALAGPNPESAAELSVPRPVVMRNSASDKSEIPYQRVRKALLDWEQAVLTERLTAARLPATLPNPVPLAMVDLAEAEEIAANVWSKIFPFLLVITAVTGAFYPAIDLGAGEKERGTMETLLISPATRTEIVVGKFLTVMLFSFTTALLNLVGMGFTGKHLLSGLGTARASAMGDLAFPPISSLMWVVLLAVPLASLFSALSLSLAMFARSSKEGQYYLTPLLLLTMGLTVFCVSPGIELTAYYSVLPVVGPALLLKGLLMTGTGSVSPVAYALPVLLASTVYSILALWWAIEQFKREDVLFREAERFDPRLWIQHLLREKEPTPSFSEAVACFVLIALLQFLFMTSLQSAPGALSTPSKMISVQLIYLIATVGVPPLLMAVMLTSNPLKTLKLSLPSWKYLAAAVILPLSLQPLALKLMESLQGFLPPIPPGAELLLKSMEEVPLWLSLAAIALAPAICEELAFRGFILTGLQQSRQNWLPIVVSSILFGFIHMIPRQEINAILMGLVLGLLAIRSQSLLPGVIFHAIFNGTQVLQAGRETPLVPSTPWLLILCGLVSATLIIWLYRSGREQHAELAPSPVPAGALEQNPATR